MSPAKRTRRGKLVYPLSASQFSGRYQTPAARIPGQISFWRKWYRATECHYSSCWVPLRFQAPTWANRLNQVAIVWKKRLDIGSKTSFGKSLVMQILPCLVPESIIIVILPLLALGAEQKERILKIYCGGRHFYLHMTAQLLNTIKLQKGARLLSITYSII